MSAPEDYKGGQGDDEMTRKVYEGMYSQMASALRAARKMVIAVYGEDSAELQGCIWSENQMVAQFNGAPHFDADAFLASVREAA